jgi:hypothetical protein
MHFRAMQIHFYILNNGDSTLFTETLTALTENIFLSQPGNKN